MSQPTSIDGTMVPLPNLEIIDASGNTWTLDPNVHKPYKNGALATDGECYLLAWWNGSIYGLATNGGWWKENGTSYWQNVGYWLGPNVVQTFATDVGTSIREQL